MTQEEHVSGMRSVPLANVEAQGGGVSYERL